MGRVNELNGYDKSKAGKIPKLPNSNETFGVIFKQCEQDKKERLMFQHFVMHSLMYYHLYSSRIHWLQKAGHTGRQ